MEYAVFGNTGFKASRIGFGGATAGLKNYLHTYDPSDAGQRLGIIRAIEKALELGINYFDTAPGYGNGLSEEMFGEALAGAHDVFLASKVSPKNRDDVRSSVEASLKRLRRDSIDLIQIHGTSYDRPTADAILGPGGMLEQLEELKKSGMIRWIGFTSEDNNEALYRFVESGRFDAMQIQYNLISQHPFIPARPFGSLYEADKRKMGIAVMRSPTSGSFQKWVQMVNPANSFDYTRALIQFVLSNPLVDVALIGMRSPERVAQNVAICDDMAGRIDIAELYRWYVAE
jgi:aryl-alcohol dehydrogenase-like predicted oxidoreductase